MKYKKEDYLSFDAAGEFDASFRCHTRKLIKARKNHDCYTGYDDEKCIGIKPGDTALFDKAIANGNWGSFYVCIPCIEKWFRGIGFYPEGIIQDVVEGLE